MSCAFSRCSLLKYKDVEYRISFTDVRKQSRYICGSTKGKENNIRDGTRGVPSNQPAKHTKGQPCGLPLHLVRLALQCIASAGFSATPQLLDATIIQAALHGSLCSIGEYEMKALA